MRLEREIYAVPGHGDGGGEASVRGPIDRAKEEASSLGVLFRQLGEDATTLVREEVDLAKLEIRREAREISKDLVQAGAALGLALVGVLALTAFLILLLGRLLDGAYWASALIVGAIFLIGGMMWARSATSALKNHAGPPRDTVETLQENARWAGQEAREFKRAVSR